MLWVLWVFPICPSVWVVELLTQKQKGIETSQHLNISRDRSSSASIFSFEVRDMQLSALSEHNFLVVWGLLWCLGGVTVVCRTSACRPLVWLPTSSLPCNNLGHLVHIHVPLSRSSIICHWLNCWEDMGDMRPTAHTVELCLYTGCCRKKWTPKVFRCFLSNRLEF